MLFIDQLITHVVAWGHTSAAAVNTDPQACLLLLGANVLPIFIRSRARPAFEVCLFEQKLIRELLLPHEITILVSRIRPTAWTHRQGSHKLESEIASLDCRTSGHYLEWSHTNQVRDVLHAMAPHPLVTVFSVAQDIL